ncbi:MAG TPA: site-2 protease family protein [Candidatus Thermoplasmatota archaeon]|nr:site-2 protease family protein [Candidatus Thermoplasmatota archaeon]
MLSNGWLIALGLVVAYVVFLVWLVQTDRMKKWNLSLMLGFALMVRTQRGKGAIEAIARPKRFWNAFGDAGTVLTLFGMLAMTLVFALTLVISLTPDTGVEPLRANEILVIPGVNPFVPLWYGLVALVVTLVVHEGGHGILARANGLRVKSLGLLVAVVPIGAFVEPDEDDLKAAPRRRRLRVFAAGPAVNLSVAALFLVGFVAMVGAAEPVEGVPLTYVTRDLPAHLAGLEPGDVIASIDGVAMRDAAEFQAFMEGRQPGERIVVVERSGTTHDIALVSRWDSLDDTQRQAILDGDERAMAACREALDPDPASGAECAERYQEQAILGVSVFRIGLIQDVLTHPVSSLQNFGLMVSLPIGEVRDAPYLSVYLPSFYEAPWGGDLFWPLATLLFWIFWINLMVGLTNILPMLPLDGGHVFRDVVGGVLERIRPSMDPARRDRVVGRTAGITSMVILTAFILQIIGPRLVS